MSCRMCFFHKHWLVFEGSVKNWKKNKLSKSKVKKNLWILCTDEWFLSLSAQDKFLVCVILLLLCGDMDLDRSV